MIFQWDRLEEIMQRRNGQATTPRPQRVERSALDPWGLFGQVDAVPYFHAPFLEEALVYFESVLGGLGGDVAGRFIVKGLHILDVYDTPLRVDEGNGERYWSICHREGTWRLCGVDKEHASIFGHALPPPEPDIPCHRVVGDLDPDPYLLATGGIDSHAGKLGCLLLCPSSVGRGTAAGVRTLGSLRG